MYNKICEQPENILYGILYSVFCGRHELKQDDIMDLDGKSVADQEFDCSCGVLVPQNQVYIFKSMFQNILCSNSHKIPNTNDTFLDDLCKIEFSRKGYITQVHGLNYVFCPNTQKKSNKSNKQAKRLEIPSTIPDVKEGHEREVLM